MMIRPDYKSFESTDLYVSPYLADEANALLSSNANKANDASSRDKRRRTVSVVAIVIALVALTFLISFNSGSNTKFTSARGSSSSDMHSFETIATGPVITNRNTTELTVGLKEDSDNLGHLMKTKKPSKSPTSRRSRKPSASPSLGSTDEPSMKPSDKPVSVATSAPSLEPTRKSSSAPSDPPLSQRPTATAMPVEEKKAEKVHYLKA